MQGIYADVRLGPRLITQWTMVKVWLLPFLIPLLTLRVSVAHDRRRFSSSSLPALHRNSRHPCLLPRLLHLACRFSCSAFLPTSGWMGKGIRARQWIQYRSLPLYGLPTFSAAPV